MTDNENIRVTYFTRLHVDGWRFYKKTEYLSPVHYDELPWKLPRDDEEFARGAQEIVDWLNEQVQDGNDIDESFIFDDSEYLFDD